MDTENASIAERSDRGDATSDTNRPVGWSNFAKALESTLDAFSSLIKVIVVASVVTWVCLHQDFFERWLWGLSGGEIFGIKFSRETIDEATVELRAQISRAQIAENKDNAKGYIFDNVAVKAALVRASRVAPAIVNSRILWIDDKTDGNEPIVALLREKLKIVVVQATSTAQAQQKMKLSPFDLIITNVWRENDPDNQKHKLSLCRVHYFDFPDSKSEKSNTEFDDINKYGKERARMLALERFNEQQNMQSPAGFAVAESILSALETDSPKVVFFSAVNAQVARPLCGNGITNDVGVLLNSIVSILGERHSEKLNGKPWESDKRADSAAEKSNSQD
jgi:hypothetical protein